MASLAQLQADVASYLNRQDILTNGVMPGWVAAVETELAETLRARCQVASAIQPIDAPYIALPSDFATMESIRDATTGEMLQLLDQWSGHWSNQYAPIGWQPYDAITALSGPSVAYRLVSNCIELLPHPQIPNPPDPAWVPQEHTDGMVSQAAPAAPPNRYQPDPGEPLHGLSVRRHQAGRDLGAR